MPSSIKLPNSKQRTVILGRTGTGKTVAGLWHLSNADLSQPWVIINFKNDEHIESIDRARHIGYDFVPGKKDAGLFILNPLPQDAKGSNSPLEKYLWKLWARENVGVFCDEALMLGTSEATDSCLTQGRSKHIPMILCSQRPVWISRYAFSEADFIQAFHLNDDRDRSTIAGFTPLEPEDFDTLEKHQSFYYDVSGDNLVRFNPVPDMDEIRKIFNEKLPRRLIRI